MLLPLSLRRLWKLFWNSLYLVLLAVNSLMLCSWNVRGAGKKGFGKVVSDLRSMCRFEVLAILEPRISGTKASKIIGSLGFSNNFIVEASGFSGGIWLLWNDSTVRL